jgi:hypothetical protein
MISSNQHASSHVAKTVRIGRIGILLLLTTLFTAGAVAAEEIEFSRAFTLADVDLGHSSITTADQKMAIDASLFNAYFSTTKRKVGKSEFRQGGQWELVLAFRQPINIGTSLLSACGNERHLVTQVLRPDFTGSLKQAGAGDWQTIPSSHVLPADFRTRSLRVASQQSHRCLMSWVCLQQRLASVTSLAIGSGEKAPFGAHPDSLPRGEVWVNTRKDPRPGAPQQIQRGPVSDATPSWYILSWDHPQTLTGLYLSCNADQFRVLAYRGDADLNPAVAPANAWRPLEVSSLHEQSEGNLPIDRLLAFPPTKILAIKLEMTSSLKGSEAVVSQMAALLSPSELTSTLPNAEKITSKLAAAGGKAIAYQQPFDGQVAMVITDAAGRTVRNLVAQVDRQKGPNLELWDLKNDAGLTVPPGTYQWKAITSPPLNVRYQMTVYPNAPQIFPGQTPWLTGVSGSNGWLADHAPITSGATSGDRVYFGAPGVEGGVCLIECDLTGRKQWGKHNFGPFSGVGRLAGDQHHLYIQERDGLHRLDPSTHEIHRLATLTSAKRQGKVSAMAARDGQVVVSMTSPIPWLAGATRAEVIDLENCLPKLATRIPDPLGTRRVKPNPRADFLRLLRLQGTPAGQGRPRTDGRERIFPATIDTSETGGKAQYVLLAFREPVPLGSVVLPNLGPDYLVDLSVLKPDAPYPPNAHQQRDWQPCPEQPKSGWTCIPMPPKTLTRGLRVRVRLATDADEPNLLDDPLALVEPKKRSGIPEFDIDAALDSSPAKTILKAAPTSKWFASFEGMKLMRRRFTNRTPLARVRVNSGEVNALGEWDAERTAALSVETPGIYVLDWKQPQKLAGLAIKEIDGAVTEIDVWDSASNSGEVPLADAPGWRNVATYQQSRRDSYEPSFERNDHARYMDGYVPFGGEITTRAVRLRVVSQWADNGQRGTSSLRADHGGRSLDPRRCRIWGVAALQYLGDEVPLDALTYQRLDVRDGKTGKLLRELPVDGGASPDSLAFRQDGALLAVQQGRIVQIDTATGASTNLLPEIDGQSVIAQRLAIGPKGDIFVYVKPEQVVHVFDRAGKKLRTIGHAGGQSPGPWDPQKFRDVGELVVDRIGQLWVVERQDVPRRIVQYAADGRFVRELYGNTHYGGGGILDPADKTRLFYHHIEFAIDWELGRSRIKNMLAQWLPDNCVPVRYQGQTYLATTPLSHQATQPATTVYRYDEERGVATLAAAFGEANSFEPLKTPQILSRLADGKTPRDYTFLWSDRNADSTVDVVEVQFELKPEGNRTLQLGRFNSALRCWAGDVFYQPAKILDNGVPVFERIASPARRGNYELSNGNLIAFRVGTDDAARYGDGKSQETSGIGPDGQKLWRYPTEHPGVSGLWLPPYEPGYVSNEFGIIGHATAPRGELGEYIVMHANNGQWKVWTADGLLAGQIFRHKLDSRSVVESSFPQAKRGMSFDNLTAGQEHFHGYFTQTADGRSYVVHGGHHIMVSEVLGLDSFRRLAGEVTVTSEDARRVRITQDKLARREARSQARVMDCLLLDDGVPPQVAERDGIRFGLGYDDKYLYARWEVSGHGLLANSGADFQRYFKTGACLDLQLGIDQKANPGRRAPVEGDLRLLFTVADGKPQAVLYQPIAADAKPEEAWETRTDAAGTTQFDRVVRVTGASLKYVVPPGQNNSYRFEAAIPLSSLGWQPQPGQLLRCDWGALTSDDGHTVKRRIYWSNELATGTTDEAWEARLDPHLWGNLVVATNSRDQRRLDRLTPDGRAKPNIADDLLDELQLKK